MLPESLLVVFDPTRDEQPALERAGIIAADLGASLHLFCCIHGDVSGADRSSQAVKERLAAQRVVLDERLAPLAAAGIATSAEVEWDKDWYHAVVRAAARNGSDLVFKSSFTHSASHRKLRATSDWTLIRECLSPVVLVKNSAPPAVPRILAGIDISVRTESYEKLNQHILEFSRQLIQDDRAEVHVVNAFPDFRVCPERNTLMEVSGLPSDRVHIKMGPPDKVIVDMAKKLQASLVVVGNSHRSGLAAMMHGNTAEKILDKLECNILVMP